MENDLDHPVVLRALRTMQIIVLALGMSVLTFAVVVLLLVLMQTAPSGQSFGPIGLTAIAGILAITSLPVAFFLPSAMANSARRAIASGRSVLPRPLTGESAAALGEDGKLALSQLPIVIVRAAILEGAALLACIAYLLEQSPLSLAIAFLLAIILLFTMPTRARLAAWVADQRKRLHDDAMLRSGR